MNAESRAKALNLVKLAAAAALVAALASCASQPRRPSFGWNMPSGFGECGNLLPYLALDGGGPRNTIYGQANGTALLFTAGMQIVADGAPNAYNPDNVSGLDDLANAGDGLAIDRYGRPFVQRSSDKYPGFYISKTELTDPDIGDSAEPRRYVDARHVPYIELPGGPRAREALRKAGMSLGDLVVVYNVRTRKTAAAIWADAGSDDELGVGSIELAQRLGYDDTSPRTGGTDDPENVYLLFPGTSLGFPRRVSEIERTGYQTFSSWGGQMRMDNCARDLGAH